MQLPVPLENHPTIIDLLDSANPRSVWNLLTPVVQKAVSDAREKEPDLFILDESDLKKRLRDRKAEPTKTDHRIRLNFWDEYEKAHARHQASMNMESLYIGICSKQYFYGRYLAYPTKIAWMLCPPANYITATKEALLFGIDQMRDILAMPMEDNNGRLNTQLMGIKLRIVDMLDKRILGAIPQKILNLHADASHLPSEKLVNGLAAEQEMARITKRIKELESRDRTRERKLTNAESKITEASGLPVIEGESVVRESAGDPEIGTS